MPHTAADHTLSEAELEETCILLARREQRLYCETSRLPTEPEQTRDALPHGLQVASNILSTDYTRAGAIAPFPVVGTAEASAMKNMVANGRGCLRNVITDE